MRIAVLGTGAIGGYYGALLQRSGNEVHFLLRSDLNAVRSHGLLVRSPRGDLHLEQVNAHATVDSMPPCDLVMLCSKSTANEALLPAVRRLGHAGATLLVMQNGLDIEDRFSDCGYGRIAGGLCFICARKAASGVIEHQDYGAVNIARWAPGRTAVVIDEALAAVVAAFQAAGIEARGLDDLFLARCQKLVWNVPFNGLSAVLRADTDVMLAHPPTRALVERLMEEVVALAAAYGRRIEPAFVDKMITNTERMVPYATSMKLDLEAGRPLEVEAILGQPLRAADALGCDLPYLRALYAQVAFLDPGR